MLNIGRLSFHHWHDLSRHSQNRRRKSLCAHLAKFCSAYGVNICSVNLDRETTYLTLVYYGHKAQEMLLTASRPVCRNAFPSVCMLVGHTLSAEQSIFNDLMCRTILKLRQDFCRTLYNPTGHGLPYVTEPVSCCSRRVCCHHWANSLCSDCGREDGGGTRDL